MGSQPARWLAFRRRHLRRCRSDAVGARHQFAPGGLRRPKHRSLPLHRWGHTDSRLWKRDALEIQCGPDGQICLAHERDGDLVWEQENVSIGDIECYLGGLAWLPTSSSLSSTPSITAGNWVDLPAPPSSHLHRAWGSPCSIHNVESIVAVVSAGIFNVSMKGILAAPLSFGGSVPTYYQQDVRSSLHLRPAAISVTGTLQR